MDKQVFDTEHFLYTWPGDTDTASSKLPSIEREPREQTVTW